ncbi:hypothetical protein NL108_013174 [Boleophthalmus pectinirostris]|uniref:numb-like protein n=1 Tax=Boleophthalmus pectinirostris TaxID=150288 RepID=UPI002432355F|nr:numb-like protein [Boleophthalmus pectinirostris]KAJ0063891.1 hypothetical protein NL108_013174 [Boleophthalmus pectinirostris]
MEECCPCCLFRMGAPKGQKGSSSSSVGAQASPDMNKLRQSLRRKKPTYVPEASRPHQWHADEDAVRRGKCSFSVRYLGLVEVEESRGMHVCEEAVKKLKASGKKTVKAVLWVSADGLRVVDDKTKDLIVDQTIEKVSFCAPDRNYDKAFSYICRDGTTRRWMCHCFMAIKDSGERLSHAVGCAFAACLERKQRREKECGVTASFDASRTSFVREGSFRGTSSSSQQGGSSSERDDKTQDKKKDPAAAVPALPSGSSSPPEGAASPMERPEPGGPHAIPRRHAPLEQLVRQGSFRGFPALSQKNSPFKRQLSLRLNDLPSTLQRKTDFQTTDTDLEVGVACDADSGINALCSQINSSFTKPSEEIFIAPPPVSSSSSSAAAAVNGAPVCPIPPLLPPPPAPAQATSSWVQPDAPLQSPPPVSSSSAPLGHKRTPSEAERWLEEVSKAVKAQQTPPPPAPVQNAPVLHPAPAASAVVTAPTGAPTIPAIPGPPSALSKALPPLSGQPQTPLPPLPLPSVPLIPAPPITGPPMSLPSMSIPTMTGPSMSGAPMIPPASLQGSMQAFPLAFDASPAPVGIFGSPPVQPAFVPMQPYMPGLASGMAYPSVVPVVGITPSQMVANVFCTAAPPSSSTKIGAGSVTHSYASPPPSAGFASPAFPSSMNGVPSLANGSSAGGSAVGVATWPPEGSQLIAGVLNPPEDDRFEAKWAALETKPGTNTPAAAPAAAPAAPAANPFSNNLQKTFEIEL